MPRDGHRLAIEISNPSAGEPPGGGAGIAIGLVEGSAPGLLGHEPVRAGDRHDDDLLPAIDRLARRLGLGPRDLAAVAVSIGPGGYTALRIAVAAAKMLCEATGAACVAVPTAQVAALAVHEPPARFGVALASKGDSAHLTIFEGGRAVHDGALARADDLAAMGLGLLVADRFLPVPMREQAIRLGLEVRPTVLTAGACLSASLALSRIDPLALAPLYPREAQAVTQWRRRNQ